MLRRAVFFDRDNTLIINDGYLGDAGKTVLMPNAAAAVGRAKALGFAVVTISNQSGVARGMFDEAAVQAVNARMDQLLLADDPTARIDLHLYCPYHPDAMVPEYRKDSDLRKPAPGMILQAAKQLDLDLPGSWVIGDALRDVEAGVAAGCKTILFVPPNVPRSTHATGEQTVLADHVVSDLMMALEIVAKEMVD
jgi:D,D-heptose 1,7-bisphosphate phosphatase